MAAKEDLCRLVNLLSTEECEVLLKTIDRVTVGERYWEDDIATYYNEYVKTRHRDIDRDPSLVPAVPVSDGIFSPVPVVKGYPLAERVILPEHGQLGKGLTEILERRRSQRDYTGDSISLSELSTLLKHACGITGSIKAYGYERLPLRTFPSAGGLQAPEVYIIVQAVEGLRSGVYHYHAINNALEVVKQGDYRSLLVQIALDQPQIEKAAVVFAVTGSYERLRWKYGPRAYRYMCMDAGFLSENLCLAGQAMELGVCAYAGFIDDMLENFLGVNGQDEVALLLLSVGVANSRHSGTGGPR
jgi:SagB-type dehydrogenase family enzyme